jgi:hypothetical protein
MANQYQIVAAGMDTEIINVHGAMPDVLTAELDALKRAAQDMEDDLPTRWMFAGQTLFIKPHGSQRQWRWILHCPALHLDLGLGQRNHVIAKARLSALFLWEEGPGDALSILFNFLADFLGGDDFRLQVSEVHLYVDVAGWDMAVEEARAFITRGHKRTVREQRNAAPDESADEADGPTGMEINLYGRRCTGFEFSKGAAHSCCIYDKTKELAKSRKEWMQAIWEQYGWDGSSRVVRVEFRYKRECLRELRIEGPYELLDQLAGLWAYSNMHWLRHMVPTEDTNRGRWLCSPFWQAIQAAMLDGEPIPMERHRKVKCELTLRCQMLGGCATSAAACLAGDLPDLDDGSHFLRRLYSWMVEYLEHKGPSFACSHEQATAAGCG